MGIIDKVRDSIRLLQDGGYESAMALACTALDATAKKEFPSLSPGDRIKRFLNKNLDIVTVVGFGGALYCAPGSKLRLKDPQSASKSHQVEDLETIVYKAIRCKLVHEASLPEDVVFTEDPFYGEKDGKFFLPTRIIWAILLAVVASPCSGAWSGHEDVPLDFPQEGGSLRQLWGNPDAVRTFCQIPTSREEPPIDPSVL